MIENSIKKIQVLNTSVLKANVDFQRKIDKRRVNKIKKEFDMRLFGTPRVALTPEDGYILWDGQHRVAALMALNKGYDVDIECEVMAMSHSEAAELFSRQSENVVKPSPLEIYNAKVKSGDEETNIMRNILETRGFYVGKNIMCVSALENSYKSDIEIFIRTLNIISKTWGVSKNIEASIIIGLKIFLNAFRNINDDLLCEYLSRQTTEYYIRSSREYRRVQQISAARGMAIQFLIEYNRTVRKPNKLDVHLLYSVSFE